MMQTGMILAEKYRILKALGQGGEGSVWLAVHIRTEHIRAIKEIRKQTDGRELHELNMMKKLRHEQLPEILDVIEEEQYLYLVMEYIRGRTLEDLMRKKGRLSPELVLDTGLQVSHILIYLHSRKEPVLHLDIKPANLILQKGGKLVLVDFGAAWKINGEKEKERRGTDGFAAPEQFDMNLPIDAGTDLYGLGATMYYLISGKHDSKVLHKSRIPGCPEYLAQAIKGCIQLKREDRIESARELNKLLKQIRKRKNRERYRCRVWAALLGLILSGGIALRSVPVEFRNAEQEEWNYEKLLGEALCTSGEEQLQIYRQALFLEPENPETYIQFLEQAQSDGVFSQEEEKEIRSFLHTIPFGSHETNEEMLKENIDAYAKLSFELAMVYWYSYEGADGKQLAAGWLNKALSVYEEDTKGAIEEDAEIDAEIDTGIDAEIDTEKASGSDRESDPAALQDWYAIAKVFAHRSTYLNALEYTGNGQNSEEWEEHGEKVLSDREADAEETGQRKNDQYDERLLAFWNDTKQLLGMDLSAVSVGAQISFYEETVGDLLFLSGDLFLNGILYEDQRSLLELAEQRILQIGEGWSETDRWYQEWEELMEQIRTAKEVIAGNSAK